MSFNSPFLFVVTEPLLPPITHKIFNDFASFKVGIASDFNKYSELNELIKEDIVNFSASYNP